MPWKICSRGHRFQKSSDCPACPICWKGAMKKKPKTDLPKIGAPAQRALDREGITSLIQLKKFTKTELLTLHGIGPKAMAILTQALQSKGFSFKK